MLRAVLESVAFTIKQLEDTFERESDYELRNIQIDGGVSQNDFVVQGPNSIEQNILARVSA